ncbi:MAG: hypothetical protein OXN89_10940 [Bryobacterales bacterium]|nr:hypothetical protein [Bryobacterales bacterium]
MKYQKHKRISLKAHPRYQERWVHERITDDARILGLGELVVLESERRQPGAGRLDILLQDPETKERYEVEIQLGATDETHIIRTIEYWDIERKRYPQYDHTAVIVAEEVTGRFLNVISLFNGAIPLIAIKMEAVQVEEYLALIFVKVLDAISRGEDEPTAPADRKYWKDRATPATVSMADKVLDLICRCDSGDDRESNIQLNYNKFYIGLYKDDRPYNFVKFRSTKTRLIVELRLEKSDDVDRQIDDANLSTLEYRDKRYRIRFRDSDLTDHEGVLDYLIPKAHGEWNK